MEKCIIKIYNIIIRSKKLQYMRDVNKNFKEREKAVFKLQNLISGETGRNVPERYIEKERCI